MELFGKLGHVARLHMWYSQEREFAFKKAKLEIRGELTAITKLMHKDIYNKDLQREVNMLREKRIGIEKNNTKGATIRSRVQWKHVGDKCSRNFFQVVCKKNTTLVISKLIFKNREVSTKRKDSEDMCFKSMAHSTNDNNP